MSSPAVFLIAGVVALTFFLWGITINYRSFKQLKATIETGIQQLESDLLKELQLVPIEELSQTQAGRELISLQQNINVVDNQTNISKEDISSQIQEYVAGSIKSFIEGKGSGFIKDGRGTNYSIDYSSFVDEGYHHLAPGEKVLFQTEWTPGGLRARNVIRVHNPTSSTNPHSRKLVIVADRTKRLRQNFRSYKLAYLKRELNTLKAFFELLSFDLKRYDIKLEDYEVVLLYEVERDLHGLSDKIYSISYDSRWGVRTVALILQILDVVADIIERASPQTADLLRSFGRGAGRLLHSNEPPLLSS